MAEYTYSTQYSPNYSSRAGYGYGSTIEGITIHWWGRMGQAHGDVADYLCRDNGDSSAHEVISGGRVTHLIDFDQASWHSGSNEGNGTQIALECRPEMSDDDMETVAQRCADIENHLGKSLRYNGHKDWYATACPGTWYDKINWIVNRVNEIHNGVSAEDDDMPSAKEIVDELLSRDGFDYPWPENPKNTEWTFKNAIEDIWKHSYYLGGDVVPSQAQGNVNWLGRNALGQSVKQGRRIEQTLAVVLKALEDSGQVQLTQEDRDAIVQGVLEGMDPDSLAAAIKDGLGDEVAQEVVDILTARLNE